MNIECCVIMVKKKRLFLAKYIIGLMLILKTMTVCTVNLKHDKQDTLIKQLFTNIVWTTIILEKWLLSWGKIYLLLSSQQNVWIIIEGKLVCRLAPRVNSNLICLKDKISCKYNIDSFRGRKIKVRPQVLICLWFIPIIDVCQGLVIRLFWSRSWYDN